MSETATHSVRKIFVGSHALTDGFRLIGFETLTEPDGGRLDALLSGLLKDNQRALLIIEQSVNQVGSKLLEQIRSEGGRIVLSEVPSLHDPDNFQSDLDGQLKKLTGG
ncbi:MAG: ATPase [Candidatus Thiodiazotropha sp. (ex Dulcina madagascariensis)]|nr:ATPase [Candidatus Thiodiazotropha sp. (ex Epidulcina cf. delphinae)]MCU7921675.1 ATPase [Candidatus Thiodiazotropha sp. (ex Dulcina madagascariensis)]MCU7928758.1 ATPase [Candidatus Thiodiazotropha sp. (ex Dulcina madagascariensis)]